jgi:hypothetical protein
MLNFNIGLSLYFGGFLAIAVWPLVFSLLGAFAGMGMQTGLLPAPVSWVLALVVFVLQILSPLFLSSLLRGNGVPVRQAIGHVASAVSGGPKAVAGAKSILNSVNGSKPGQQQTPDHLVRNTSSYTGKYPDRQFSVRDKDENHLQHLSAKELSEKSSLSQLPIKEFVPRGNPSKPGLKK